MDGQYEHKDISNNSDEKHEAFLQRAVDEFPNNLFVAKIAEGKICSISIGTGVAALIGYDTQELQSEPELWIDIVHPADELRIRQTLARLGEGKPLAEVYRIFQKNGQLRWIRVSAVAAGRDDLYHAIGIVSDASLEKTTPDRLVQYKQLLDQTPTPVSLRTPTGQIIYCNQAYAELIGYESVEEAMLTLPSDIIPAQDFEFFEREILPKMVNEPWQGELRMMRKDGQTIDVDVATNPLFGPDGESIGFYSALTDVTQRKHAEEALRESEEKYRNLVERSGDGVVVIQDFIYKFANERFARMLGYSVEHLIGTKFVDLHPPDEKAILQERYSRRIAGEKVPQIYELQLTRADGSKIDVEVNAEIINYEGRPADLVLFRDITQRKRDEQELRESEEKYRNLVERSNDGILVLQDFIRKFVNNRFAQMVGYSVEQLVDKEFTELLVPEERALAREKYVQRMAGKEVPPIYEIHMIRADGTIIDVEINAGVISYQGRPADLIVLRDITQRKRDEQALRESEEKYRTLVERSNDGIIVLQDSIYKFANNQFAQMSGYSLSQLIGAKFTDFLTPEVMEFLHQRYIQRMAGETVPPIYEVRLTRADGSRIDVEINAGIISYEGRPADLVLFRDITQRKRDEQALRESEEKYRTFVERSNDGIIVLQDFVFKFINDRFVQMSGYSLDQLIGATFTDFLTPEEAAILQQRYIQRMAGEIVPPIYELQMTRADSSKVDVEINAGIISYEGRPADLVLFRDITQRKRDEQALRESEEKYRTFVERSNDGITVLQDSVFKFVNDRFAQMSGYSMDQLIGATFTDFLTPEEAAILQQRYIQRMAGEIVPPIYELQMTRADGNKIDVEINAGIITYEGRPADLVLFRDVTQRKRDEQALRESEEQLRTLVENIDAVVLQIDPQMRVLTAGGQIDNWLGLPMSELVGNRGVWRKFVSQQHLEQLRTAMAMARKKKTSQTVEIKVKHKSGRERWIRGQITPRFDDDGNLIYFDGVGMDATEKVEAVEREARHSRLIAALVDMSQVFASTRDTDKIISTAVKTTGGLLECMCSVQKIEPGSKRLHFIESYSADEEKGSRVHNAVEQLGITLEDVFGPTGIQAGISADLMFKSPRSVELAKRTGLKSSIAVPLYVEGELFGVFSNARMADEKPFDDEDLWFMSEVASHASASLTNASLYRKQTRIAETLQRSLIPEKTAVRGLDTATLYLPAKGDVGIGGDFFDIIDFGNSTVGLVVADVSGKGLEAAIHTAEAKYMLRGFARQNPDPGFVMTNLNYALWTYMGEFAFVTMFYGLINIEKCSIEYVNAGHESPLILCRDTNQVLELLPNGVVLGVEPNRYYVADNMQFELKDLLFCYTDGLTDVPSEDGTRFGYNRLVETIRHAPSLNSQELLEYVTGIVHEFSKGNQPDDQVVVVVGAC